MGLYDQGTLIDFHHLRLRAVRVSRLSTPNDANLRLGLSDRAQGLPTIQKESASKCLISKLSMIQPRRLADPVASTSNYSPVLSGALLCTG